VAANCEGRIPAYRHELPTLAWLWFPPVLLIAALGVRAYDERLYRNVFNGELGIVELATPTVLAFAIGFGLAAWRLRENLSDSRARVWLALVTVGCVYFAGEELSWGQHLVGWRTPGFLEQINDQRETNMHNISSWLDQKPRMLLELWVLIGGVIYPLSRRRRRTLKQFQEWFWPTLVCVPSAALAIAVRVPERLKSALNIEALPLEIRYSESQEYYFALFLAMYLASIWMRLRATPEVTLKLVLNSERADIRVQ